MKISMNITQISLVSLIGILMMTGCQRNEPTVSADIVLTSIAQTVAAALKTEDQVVATMTPRPSPTLSPTPTLSQSPSPEPEMTLDSSKQNGNPLDAETCDNATFISDVTIPDGTQMAPGTVFTKTWRIQNSGTCTWTSEYMVAFSRGAIMEAAPHKSLAVDTLLPGGTVDISIEMIAPDATGQRIGYWRMQNAKGDFFGDTFFVDVYVTKAPATPTLRAIPESTQPNGEIPPSSTPTNE
jgi:hypothetical protein